MKEEEKIEKGPVSMNAHRHYGKIHRLGKEETDGINGYRLHKALLMRRAHDKRPDTEVKSDMLDQYFPDHSWVKEIIDDRPSVIRMWQEKGLNVKDVGSGVEF